MDRTLMICILSLALPCWANSSSNESLNIEDLAQDFDKSVAAFELFAFDNCMTVGD